MVVRPKDFNSMVSDALEYLSTNTQITYLAQGSVARSMIDAPLLEISRLQDFVVTNYDNSFLSSASGPFLDLIGEGLGTTRNRDLKANVFKEDGIIRFYVKSGTLGQRLPDPLDSTKGLIPKSTIVSNANGNIQYSVREDTQFPLNARSVFVGAVSISVGSGANIGPNQLTSHSLNKSDVFVTNDLAINTGQDTENDEDYRFRLSRAFSTRFSNNGSAVQVAALSIAGIVKADLLPFARGAGTFDVLLIPRGNKLPRSVKNEVIRSINKVTAYGISPQVREPDYIPIKVTVRLRYAKGTAPGVRDALRDGVQSAILNYIGNIPLGGELIINQLRSTVLGASSEIIDMTLLELCIDGRPSAIRNFKLQPDELFIPDEENEAIVIV